MNGQDVIRDRAKRLYNFILELTRLRYIPVRDYRNYEPIIPLKDLPPKPDCRFIARQDFDKEEDYWLEVRCPKLENYPEPPPELSDWLDPSQLSDPTRDMPELLSGYSVSREDEDIDEEYEPDITVRSASLSDSPEPPEEIKIAWERYIEERWWPWAEQARPKYRAKKLYDDLFRMYQKQEHLGETYEIIAAFGLLSWRPSEAVEVRRHLVTVELSLELDSRRQILSLGPTASGVEAKLEEDMLDPTQRAPSKICDSIREKLRQIGARLWDSENLHELLQEYGNALSSDAQYDRSDTPPEAISSSPVVTFAPTIILRKRGNEGMIGLLEAIIKEIENDAEIPPAVLRQVFIVENDGNRDDLAEKTIVEDDEIYFPLPANREQYRIIESLARADGIVIEGPPGTGKSHTIANLICHLLAVGKRVLVTSHTARALQVLRKMIPDPVRALCVQALSNDAKGMQALEESVQGITDRHLKWKQDESDRTIDRLSKELGAARERFQEAINEARAIREAEIYRHSSVAGKYSGTLAEIARQLKSEESDLGIIRDVISTDHVPPCSADDFRSLLSVIISEGGQIIDGQVAEPPNVRSLIAPERFEELIDELGKFELAITQHKDSPYADLAPSLAGISPETRQDLEQSVRHFATQMKSLRRQRSEPWLNQAINDVFCERDRIWIGRLSDTQKRLKELNDLPGEIIDARVVGHELYDDIDSLECHANALLELFERRKGKAIRLRCLLPRLAKDALSKLANVRIDGQSCIEVVSLKALKQWIKAAHLLDGLDKEWESLEQLPAEGFRRRIERYEDICERLNELLGLLGSARELSSRLEKEHITLSPVWHDDEDLQSYLGAFSCADALAGLEARKNELEALADSVKAMVCQHPGVPDIQDLADACAKKDAHAYRRAYNKLREDHDAWQRNCVAVQTLQKIAKVAPMLVEELKEHADDTKWSRLAERWDDAWAWAAARTWLQQKTAPDAAQKVAARINDEQKQIRDLLGQLASWRAWSYCLGRLTEEQRQSLQAWSNAVRRIGKGMGKYANQHRKAAREHLAGSRDAIPAWVMPMYRVAESVRPGKARFDVAIIDEASQSGLEALALLFLADKIVVVGDDKQISPERFTRVEDVNRLRRELISDLPMSDILDPENSIFDLAKIRYPDRIRLVEHFRCMPEIIQFSNNLCYRDEPLIPLRQFGAGRLDPVINAVYVQKGYNRGINQKINPPEATAIARKVAELIGDKRYEGKTFGIISLLGDRQARYIETELLSLIDPKELDARSLICGNAYDFQGDERDVMFLSLVVAPVDDGHISSLSDPKGRDTRRYNVAFSRARDQVWLFHSVTLNDLNPNDLRAQLLAYCQNPGGAPRTVGEVNIDDLAMLARGANRAHDRPPGKFESWFEVDVFLKIAERGYHVIPQYEVSGYFIDLAIVGQNSKLAVECDGDHWHGAEQWGEDSARQRDLERCGWPFFRLRESTFYFDSDTALEPLWKELDRHGIRPLCAMTEEEPCQASMEDLTTDYEEPISASDRFPDQDRSLPPYEEWEPRPVPDPRYASQESVIKALIEIVSVEGPATWRRIFDLYRLGLGLKRLKGPTRDALERAARRADDMERLQVWPEIDSGDWYDYVVHIPNSERVKVRQRGPRDLRDVPCSEIAELMRQMGLVDADEDWAFRTILQSYGLRRLTEQARAHLRAAAQMAQIANNALSE